MIEYEVPDRDGDGKGEVIALVTTITEMTAAPAPLLAEAYHQRWEHETGNAQLKTSLRGPGKVLRSKSPDMVRQEIYGYLLTHYAMSRPDLPGRHRSGHRPGPGQVQAHRPHRPPPGRRPGGLSPLSTTNASSPRSWPTSPANKHLNPGRRHRTYPRVVKRARHNSYRVKRPGDHGTRHTGPATIRLVNLPENSIAA